MYYKFKLALRRLLKKENVYFIEESDLAQFIIDRQANCSYCKKTIKSIEDIYKIKLRKKEIIFYCNSCPEEAVK